MKTRSYQMALAAAVAASILLAAALGFVLLRGWHKASDTAAEDPVVARGPESAPQPAASGSASPAGAEPALAPFQLSPQHLQEIGVTTATVTMKEVNDDL
ncbi:MAG TPA: efflux RND transporter periplasmic adaptor subunit, partial [Terracidiphilus sp.]|nr:efflux RND transporter periplasmic adaptor subunit [Terracidiphilus sp.]